MTRHGATSLRPRSEGRVIAGVCAGIAQALAVDVTLVRLVFTLLALAGGAGILLYLALWSYGSSSRPWWALLVLAAGVVLLHAVGLSDRAVAGAALVATGLALVWHRRGTLRPDSPRAFAGLVLAGLGVVLVLEGHGGRRRCCRRVRSPGPCCSWSARGSGGSHSSAMPSALRGSAPRSAPRSLPAFTTPCCRHSR